MRAGRPVLILALAAATIPAGAAAVTLRAGAARLEITPPADAALPMSGYGSRTEGHKGIHDPLFTRAIFLDDGSRRAVIVSSDVIFMPEAFWNAASERIARETGVPREHILLAATHTHGGPSLTAPRNPEFAARWQVWIESFENRVVEAACQAAASAQPARIGSGTGKAYINTNRRARLANGGWGLGVNPEGVSDKTVSVVRIDNASGEPLAILMHYAVHGVVMGPRNYQITSDLPGFAERFVEQRYGDKTVAAFLAGASGDQNPIYEPGDNFSRVAALGAILGEEVVRVAGGLRTSPKGRIFGAQRVVSCPGRTLTADSDPRQNRIRFEPSDPVDIRLSLLMVSNIAFAGVSGEVLTGIAQRLSKESPFSRTLLVAHANGSSGYIPDDASFSQVSYEIWVSKLQPGCAEGAIVDGFLALLDEY